MGVDFDPCAVCGEVVCDCGDNYHICAQCGEVICTDCLAAPLGYDDETGEMLEECCPFCSGEKVQDAALMAFLLDKLGMSREEAEKAYRRSE